MKNIVFLLLLLVLAGCANNKAQEQPSAVAEPSAFKKKAIIEVTSGSIEMSIVNPYYAFVEDVVIDIAQDGSILTTYTDSYNGSRVTVRGDCYIMNLEDYKIRDWRDK